MKVRLALALAASLAATAHAQPKDKLPVYVECQAEASDTVGNRFCTDMRDAVSRSPRYRLMLTVDEPTYFEIRLVHVVYSDSVRGGAVATSMVMTLETKDSSGFLTNSVYFTGGSQTASQSADILASFDAIVNRLLKQ